MKKIFTFAAALLASLSMMAQTTFTGTELKTNPTTKDGVTVTLAANISVSSQQIWKNGSTGVKADVMQLGNSANQNFDVYYVEIASQSAITAVRLKAAHNQSGATTTYTFPVVSWSSETASASFDAVSVLTAPGKEATVEPGFLDVTLCDDAHVVRVYRTIRVNADHNAFSSSNYEALGDGKTIYLAEIEVETGMSATKYTVTYMDGENVLGTESVKEGENATKASTHEAKAHATFDGWFEDAAFTTPATFTNITADKTVYGKWTADAFTASSSINIEQLVLDNGKSYDIAGALTAAHIAYANIDALDSLDSSKGSNNEPYLGLKLKKKDAYLEVALNNGDALKVKFGAVAAAFKVSVDGVESSMETSTANNVYELTADKNEYVRFTIVTDNKTVVFKQIMINQDIQEIDQPAVVNDATLATLTLDGVAIEGFAASKKEYTITLAAGTTLPVVAATANDANATVGEIAQATTLPGDATFTVTAADGTTTATYTIHFVLPREIDYLTAPYETSIPADFELPDWLAGCTVNLAYAGADTVVAGYDVIRFEKTDTVSMYVENVDSVIVDLSATGTRTVAIAVAGEEKANSGSFNKNTLKTLGAYIHSEEPVIVKIYGVGVTGGTTISRIKLTEYGSTTPTGLNNLEAVKAVKVIENGQIVIIKNGVRYNAVGAKL